MVMVYHLLINWLPLGTYPVFGFYLISGYLMTLIMHDSYGYNWRGRVAFISNRFLRLYPLYWAAALTSILLVLTLGVSVTTGFHNSIYLPVSVAEILHNLFIAFTAWIPSSINPRLVPPAWALTVEIFFYILICLGISKTFTRVKVWVLLSICYVIATYMIGSVWTQRYFPVAAASLPFSMGASIYFLSKDVKLSQRFIAFNLSPKRLFFLMIVNCFAWAIVHELGFKQLQEIGVYLNLLICFGIVYSLALKQSMFDVSAKIDKHIGDYSYPIYLFHWQSGLLASFLIFGVAFHELSMKGLLSFLGSIFVVVGLSTVFIFGIDHPVQSMRSRIKADNRTHR